MSTMAVQTRYPSTKNLTVFCFMSFGTEPGIEHPLVQSSEVLKTRDRTMGGVTATADGLYLCGVSYSAGYNLPPAPPPCRFW